MMLPPGFVIFKRREKMRSGKSYAPLFAPGVRSGLDTYKNVQDRTQTGRDSVGP